MTFIALEGGEGVGKTTQMRLLQDRLPTLLPEREFVFTREPGGTPFGERIRDLILSDESKDADGKTMFGLFAAARADHIRRVIKPALAANKIVVTDRFAAATYAYQVHAQDMPITEELFDEYYRRNLETLPVLTLILDMDAEKSQERLKTRAADQSNHFDARALAFHMKLLEGYHRFAEKYGGAEHEVVLVDASPTPEEVHADIVRHLTKLFGEDPQ